MYIIMHTVCLYLKNVSQSNIWTWQNMNLPLSQLNHNTHICASFSDTQCVKFNCLRGQALQESRTNCPNYQGGCYVGLSLEIC